MSFKDKSIEELYDQLAKVERERDGKGPKHPDYKLADIPAKSIRKAIKEKE